MAWNVRRNLNWDQNRNLTDYEFLSYYERISLRHENKRIVLVSDLVTIDYYMNLAAKKNLRLEQSKSFGDSFIDDAHLVLNSDFYYQLKGGGMAIVPMLSDLPYEVVSGTINENYWRYPTFTSWQKPSQNFIRDIRLLDSTFYFGQN